MARHHIASMTLVCTKGTSIADFHPRPELLSSGNQAWGMPVGRVPRTLPFPSSEPKHDQQLWWGVAVEGRARRAAHDNLDVEPVLHLSRVEPRCASACIACNTS